MNRDLTQERLKELLHYDPETGIFTWLQNRKAVAKKGDKAGFKVYFRPGRDLPYVYTAVDNCKYPIHCLAFLYMTGSFPINGVDHINGDSSDNRWANLRDVPTSENNKNFRLKRNNTTGVSGVFYDRWTQSRNKWRAHIFDKGKRIDLGRHPDLESATKVRKAAEVEYGYHPNHGRIV